MAGADRSGSSAGRDERADGPVDADICTYTCYYKDSPGWQLFMSESGRITDEYATTVGAWNRTVSAAAQTVRNRTLPERPVV